MDMRYSPFRLMLCAPPVRPVGGVASCTGLPHRVGRDRTFDSVA